MNFNEIQTGRLLLIPATAEIFEFELEKKEIPDVLKDIYIPENWPHESVTRDVLELFFELAKQEKIYTFYWVMRDISAENRVKTHKTLIGSGGFISQENGNYELGYSVIEQFRNRGYATEAIRAMIRWSKYSGLSGKIIANTEPGNNQSIKVLEKNGFVPFANEADSAETKNTEYTSDGEEILKFIYSDKSSK
ncbi:GNAT family N-acetyltransferase [Methanoplanus endosymbiosus]|uniref:GNAT family N-acetyltransferase n=1 Tax=Methanoplanus endosymbiosus TaxID=33865 RepID=A0A9E7TIH3_9EURY|nr:GNAT family N-acetyltransferase [Methanoplanus endosymbiosus]UUX92473.1 GNAT family N-acetyltransferase [Methanoplanus endosymbiosus]